MLDTEINNHLGLLQEELQKLKKITDYIDGAKHNSTNIIVELDKIQKNYGVYSEKLHTLYENEVARIGEGTEKEIANAVAMLGETGLTLEQEVAKIGENAKTEVGNAVLRVGEIGSAIEKLNNERLNEIKNLIKQYQTLFESTDRLVKKIDEVSFPQRLNNIDTQMGSMNGALEQTKDRILENAIEGQKMIVSSFEHKINSRAIASQKHIVAELGSKIQDSAIEIKYFLDSKIELQKSEIVMLKSVVLSLESQINRKAIESQSAIVSRIESQINKNVQDNNDYMNSKFEEHKSEINSLITVVYILGALVLLFGIVPYFI